MILRKFSIKFGHNRYTMTEFEIVSGGILKRKIKYLILIFIAGLVLSGITAFPLLTELEIVNNSFKYFHWSGPFVNWIDSVFLGVQEIHSKHPFIAYGTDWLAFAHLVIAIVFIGPLRDPVRNIWVIEFGLIACAGIFPLALIAGEVREIPVFWRLVDCSFGLFGGIVLLICYRMIKQLEKVKLHAHVNIQ